MNPQSVVPLVELGTIQIALAHPGCRRLVCRWEAPLVERLSLENDGALKIHIRTAPQG
jgi:hypothetical protein